MRVTVSLLVILIDESGGFFLLCEREPGRWQISREVYTRYCSFIYLFHPNINMEYQQRVFVLEYTYSDHGPVFH